MAVVFTSNLDVSGDMPDIIRQQYATLADMKSVVSNMMPSIYLAYCLETHRYYVYDKTNDDDDTLGLWRDFSSQIKVMPSPDTVPVGTVYQYIGNSTISYTQGYFYKCDIESEETQTVAIDTLEEFKALINESETLFKVYNGKKKVNKKYYTFNEVKYYIDSDIVYYTSSEEGDLTSDSTIDTDEAVAAIGITKEVTVYTYQWTNLSVGAGGGSSESIQKTTLPEASESESGKIYQYIGETDQYTQGYFYECAITGSQIETHDPQTIDVLKYDIEHYPTGTIQVNTGSDPEELDCLLNYYVYDNTIYRADNETGSISTDTALTTDEMVVDEHLMYEVDAPVYGWEQKDVQPSIVAPEIVQMLFQDRPFVIEQLDNAPTEQDTGDDFMLYTYTVGRLASLYTYDTDHWISLGRWSGSGLFEALPDFTWDLYQKILLKNLRISNAGQVDYDNLNYSELTNVGAALDNILAKIYYVNPAISSFTMTPSTTEYEIGASVSDLVFNWTTNKDITTQTLTDCTLADATVRTATAAGPYTSNKTFTLSIGDGENTATSSKSISFKHKVYWGSAAEPNGAYDSAFILALSNKKFATNYKGTYSMTVAQDEFGFIACPTSWNIPEECYIGGFLTTLTKMATIEFTNASGNTTNFDILRTGQHSLGSISMEFR